MTAAYPWLVADIGGTNARFGYVQGPGAPVSHIRVLPVRDHEGPASAARAYLEVLQADGLDLPSPRRAAFAVATVVHGDQIDMTNAAWSFSRRAVQDSLALDALLFLNDFEALALSLPRLGAAQLRAWDGQAPKSAQAAAPGTVMAVIGPGTGLGVGAVLRTRDLWQALPGEGGHATLAPGDDFESAVLSAARRDFPHVSAERLLSGIGLPVLHRSVAAALGLAAEAPLPTEEIVRRGLSQECAACSRALDLFCAMLGSFAGNVALTVGARGGIFIGGGIVPRLGERFFASEFRRRFESKGRLSEFVAAIPTYLITDTLVALAGATQALEQLP